MKYIDVHAHVNFRAFDNDRDAVIKRALQEDVWMINVGTQQHTSKQAVDLAKNYERGVYAIVGLHPIHTSASYHDTDELGEESKPFTSRGEVFDTKFYRELLASPRVVGVGECGLDYFRIENDVGGTKQKQKDALHMQIELALEKDVPLMIHTRPEKGTTKAYHDTLDILSSYSHKHGSKLRGDFHFFAGDLNIAKRIIDLGFTCSFTGAITFTHDYDEIVSYIPIDRILAETDCPYVTPEPHRGKRNEPLYVKYVVEALARIRNTTIEAVSNQVRANSMRLFALEA